MCAVSIAQRGQRDAHIFIEHGRGRGVARGYIRASARCYLAAQSGLGKFQHGQQLEPGGGADQYRVLRRVEYNLNIIRSLHNDVDRNAAIQPWCACVYFRYVFTPHHINQHHRCRHRQQFFQRSDFYRRQPGVHFFPRYEQRRQRHHNHQRRWAHRIRRQRHRRECTFHHPCRRRIRHNLPVEWRDGGRLDRGRGNFSLGPNLLTVGSNNLSTTVSGLIRGTGGSLVKVGSGTLTLDGSNSYTGATVVAGGTLSVTGDISPSSGVLVGPTAMLSGTGTVPSVLVAGGTLMPGLPNAIGTLNVAGNLVFTSAATYLININATTASQTNVTGTATLNGATVQVVDDKNISKRQVYTLLTATGGVNGTFNPDVVGVKNKVDLFYDANHVFLCDHCKFSDLIANQLPFFPVPGSSPGSLPAVPAEVAEIVGALDAAIDANVTLPARLENLFAVSRAQVVNALTQLTGEVHTGAEQASFQSTNSFLRLMLDPFAETRGTAGFGSAMGFAPERSAAFPPDVALAYASVLKSPRRRRRPPLPAAPGTSGPRVMAAAPISAAIR